MIKLLLKDAWIDFVEKDAVYRLPDVVNKTEEPSEIFYQFEAQMKLQDSMEKNEVKKAYRQALVELREEKKKCEIKNKIKLSCSSVVPAVCYVNNILTLTAHCIEVAEGVNV